MYLRYCIIPLLFIVFACSRGNGSATDLAILGFYGTPDDIITQINGENLPAEKHFMLGLAWKEKKDYKKALYHLANSCFDTYRAPKLILYAQPVHRFVTGFHFKSDYYDDALYEIGNIFYLYREHAYVDKFLHLVSRDNRALYLQAQLLIAQNLKHSGKIKEALGTLKELLDNYSDPSSRSLVLIKKASIHEETAAPEKALPDYFTILEVNPGSWQAALAASRIYQLQKKGTITLDATKNEILGAGLYTAQQYSQARQVLESISSLYEHPESTPFRLLIRTYARTGFKTGFESLIKKSPQKVRTTLEFLYADELWSMNRKYLSIPYYRKLLNSGDMEIEKISLRRLAYYTEDRTAAGFMDYLVLYTKKFPDDPDSHTMLWLLGRHSIKKGAADRALEYLSTSNSRFPEGKYSDQCRFWMYKIYLKTGKNDLAGKAAQELVTINPDSPYAWITAHNLAAESKPEELNTAFKESLDRNDGNSALFYNSILFSLEKDMEKRDTRIGRLTAQRAPYEKISVLLEKADKGSLSRGQLSFLERYTRIGYDEAVQRTCGLIPVNGEWEIEKNALLAVLGKKYSNHFYSVYHSQELMKLLSLKENIFIMPEKAVKLILPLAFSECLQNYSGQYKVDINKILSVIKAESLFNHRAVSSAGAVGLMQLMPPTAKDLARELGMKMYDLKNPCTSIQFGTRYLAWLQKFFKNNFACMVAGYNAGAGNVQKWKKKFSAEDDDFFTEFIPFLETRYYILRTGKFLYQYDCVYKENI